MFGRHFVSVTVLILLAACAGLPVAAGAHPVRSQPGDKTEPPGKDAEPLEIEEVQEVAPVQQASRPEGVVLIGRLHPALVHFPIAWVFLLVLLESFALATGRDQVSRAAFPLLALACLSFAPAAVTGFLRAASMGNDPEFRALMVPHRNMNVAAGAACLTALVVRMRAGQRFYTKVRWPYLLLIGGAGALLLMAGHLGGKLVFGPGYLPF